MISLFRNIKDETMTSASCIPFSFWINLEAVLQAFQPVILQQLVALKKGGQGMHTDPGSA